MEYQYKEKVSEIIKHAQHDLSDISNYLWSNPETGYKEVKAHDKITDYLEKKGFQVQRRTPTDTAFLATFTAPSIAFSERKKPVHVALMCEYDALPGIGHACGHNLIAIVGLGAAVAIKEVLESEVIAGKVTVIGCPAEEGGGGKVDHINVGNFENVDFALMAHPNHINISSPKYLAREKLSAKFLGKASHASDNPWEGRNALDAVVLAYQSVACLRQQFQAGWQFHGIITKGGEAPNVIPAETEMVFYLRANKSEELQELHNRVLRCFQSAAAATDCQVEVFKSGHSYENIDQNEILENLYVEYFENISSPESVKFVSVEQALGSTDMGNVSKVVPSLHPAYEICDYPIHTKDFAESSSTMTAFNNSLIQAEVLAAMSLRLMIDTELLKKVKEKFDHK